MPTQLQTSGNRSAFTVKMIIGSPMLLLALGGPLALSFWGQTRPGGAGEQWNNVIAAIVIALDGLLVFVSSLPLVLIGWVQKERSKRKIAPAGQDRP